jgi:hypothetical protein
LARGECTLIHGWRDEGVAKGQKGELLVYTERAGLNDRGSDAANTRRPASGPWYGEDKVNLMYH